MDKKRWYMIIAFLSIAMSIFAIGESQNIFIGSTLWSLNDDTLVLTNSSHNVNIGENASTLYKLRVDGQMYVNETSLFNDNVSISLYKNLRFGKTISLFQISTLGIKAILTGYNEMDIISKNNLTIKSTDESIIFNSTTLGFGVVPLGGTISWCNHIGSIILPIPEGWWVCNGSTINYSDSIFHNQVSPNLTNRFIRGSNNLTSGYTGGNNSYLIAENQVPYHRHSYIGYNLETIGTGSSGTKNVRTTVSGTFTGYYGGNPQRYVNNQPSYYDMVILVRIK